MSHTTAVEIDFMGVSSNSKRSGSLREIQKAVSRLNPELLRSVIASGGNTRPLSPMRPVAPMPVLSSGSMGHAGGAAAAPLTIFYNGTVSVFNVSHDLAEMIMKVAEKGTSAMAAAAAEKSAPEHRQQQQGGGLLLEKLDVEGDLPLARKKSLKRFLEKRRERLTALAPYPASPSSSVGDVEGFVANKNIKEQLLPQQRPQQQQKKKRSSPQPLREWSVVA